MSGENNKNFCMADPNLIKLKGKEYLVLTTFSSPTERPSVCFYKLRQNSKGRQKIKDRSGENKWYDGIIPGGSSLKIYGAEFLVNSSEQAVKVFTNPLLSDVQISPEDARMRAPSQIIELEYEKLKKMTKMNENEALSYLARLSTSEGRSLIETDQDSMVFFRTESHRYSFVEVKVAKESLNQTNPGLTLHFYGRKNWPSLAIYFNPKQPEANQD